MEEDERREAAIASTPSLQPNFNPVGVTKQQLSKFQELHKRRVQIKSRTQKKPKGGTAKPHGKDLSTKDFEDEDSSIITEGSRTPISEGGVTSNSSSLQEKRDKVPHLATKKRKKLHWGLDTKERWERKANM